jgi:hypothetical protein
MILSSWKKILVVPMRKRERDAATLLPLPKLL